ncbi:PucR family transcriptional regulator [Ktedonosporobacter rubrisoli]|uniref:PucR family transcriptional regulator n=1 Tax=Ktedonosporobacter rubrisoli TaxID=2509675 RepID=A0A4P6K3J2_KTERU|nr:PucR family transcriptional regulator ligand-binding domain-containing protein [Ktedonosporobacter rubrisoli]QBD82759.1 PucR family transcriptional regulator [Ktedonosporobacter rubrisoli]
MTFTVRDALRTGRLSEAHIRAGADGLGRIVSSVNVMEVPDILAWIKPHELLLTTLYPLRDDPASLGSFVLELAQRELAGIVVKTGRYFEAIPQEMCSAAERCKLPLIELRSEVSFDEIITELLSSILSVQTQRLQHSEEVHRRFTAIVLAGGGLQHIADNLALLIGNPVAIIAPDRRILALAAADDASKDTLNAFVRVRVGVRYLHIDTSMCQGITESTVSKFRCNLQAKEKHFIGFACAIRVGAHNYGSIVTLETNRQFDYDEDAIAMEHAATVSALAVTKEQAIVAVERKFQSDFLDDLLAGRILSMETVISRAQTLDWRLDRPGIVYVVEVRGDDLVSPASGWQAVYRPDTASSLLLESARAAAKHVDSEAIVVEKSGQLIFILGAAPARVGYKGARLKASFKNDIDVGQHLLRNLRFLQRDRQFVMGIGRPCEDALHLHRSYREAQQALAIGSQLQGSGTVIHFNDLGFQRILSQFENPAELQAFAEELLGTLIEYDTHHDADLLYTLEVLLNSNLNMAVAARRLHLHYNSLRYRLQKIEELTGPFMDDAQQRMNLELALQIRKANRE